MIYFFIAAFIAAVTFALYNLDLIIIKPISTTYTKYIDNNKKNIHEHEIKGFFYLPGLDKPIETICIGKQKKTDTIESIINTWCLYVAQETDNTIITHANNIALGNNIIVVTLTIDGQWNNDKTTIKEYAYCSALLKTIRSYAPEYEELYIYQKDTPYQFNHLMPYINHTMITDIEKKHTPSYEKPKILYIPLMKSPHGNIIDSIYEENIYQSCHSGNIYLIPTKKIYSQEWFNKINSKAIKNNSDLIVFLEIYKSNKDEMTVLINPYLQNDNNCLTTRLYHYHKKIITNVPDIIYNYSDAVQNIVQKKLIIHYCDHKAFGPLTIPSIILSISCNNSQDIEAIKNMIALI
jgi:hypothetical protein